MVPARNDALRVTTALAGIVMLFFAQPLAQSKVGHELDNECRSAGVHKSYIDAIIEVMQLEPFETLDPKLRRELAEYGAALCIERHAKEEAMTRFHRKRDRFVAACRENGASETDLAAAIANAARLVDECVKVRTAVLRFHVPLDLIAKETVTGICFSAIAHVFDSPDDVVNIDRVVPSRKQF